MKSGIKVHCCENRGSCYLFQLDAQYLCCIFGALDFIEVVSDYGLPCVVENQRVVAVHTVSTS